MRQSIQVWTDKFFKGCLPQNLFSLLLNTLSQIFHSVTATRTRQFGKTIQFNIQFTWTLWSSKKTTEMEYGQIKALEIHKSKGQKKISTCPGENIFLHQLAQTQKYYFSGLKQTK